MVLAICGVAQGGEEEEALAGKGGSGVQAAGAEPGGVGLSISREWGGSPVVNI